MSITFDTNSKNIRFDTLCGMMMCVCYTKNSSPIGEKLNETRAKEKPKTDAVGLGLFVVIWLYYDDCVILFRL